MESMLLLPGNIPENLKTKNNNYTISAARTRENSLFIAYGRAVSARP